MGYFERLYGKGSDIFFSLRVAEEHAETPRYFLICDQRKRLSRDLTPTVLSQIISKAALVPKCVPGSGNQMVLGIINYHEHVSVDNFLELFVTYAEDVKKMK